MLLCLAIFAQGLYAAEPAPGPLLNKGQPVDWWFVFKLNSKGFPGCAGTAERICTFGGNTQDYKLYSQQFAYASNNDPVLRQGSGCVGDTVNDPLGATFDQIYNGAYNYVVWNDQFYGDPEIKFKGCGSTSCASPWGHAKGALAWNDAGEGFVLQVTTPSWPASGSSRQPRKTDGNTLGCVKDDDVEVSQHFFSVKLGKDDVVAVLKGLQNASVVTDPKNPQIVRNGGPRDIQTLVSALGQRSASKAVTKVKLSSGVVLISKPSQLQVPPWQMVSALLGGPSLRVASWWAHPTIPSTSAATPVRCWDKSLKAKPGAVEIATTGAWAGRSIGLKGGLGPDFNHAKIGVTTSGNFNYVILGDMNQQGALSPAGKSTCASSQNGRGGLFYVLDDAKLFADVSSLIKGDSAPVGK